MKKYVHVLTGVFIFAILFSFNINTVSAVSVPYAPIPDASTEIPLYIYIPSIKLYTTVQGVGIDEKGRMDVPSGKTKNVGWYQYGVVPGNIGTAVFAAHNTAIFKNLKKVPVNAEVYVYTSSGKWQKFVVNKAKTYEAKSTDPKVLFESTNKRQINLITCDGKLLGGGEATHRLIVSAQLSS